MEIIKISMQENRYLIPLKGWSSVAKALNIFANGNLHSSRVTKEVTANAINDSLGSRDGSLGVGMFLLGENIIGRQSNLVENLLKEAEGALKKYPKFNKSYDYDGMGTPFFKTFVNIEILDEDQDMYAIGLYGTYSAGNRPEEELAKYLNIPRTLISCHVEIETKPFSANRFEFDFEPVIRKLDTLFKVKKITGRQIAAAMMVDDDVHIPTFVLHDQDELRVQIQTGRVKERLQYKEGVRRDTWAVKGSKFSGELERDYNSQDNNAKATPTFVIRVSSSQNDFQGRSLRIWQPDQQQKMIDLANKIMSALQS